MEDDGNPLAFLDALHSLCRRALGGELELVSGWPRAASRSTAEIHAARGIWLWLRDAQQPARQAAAWMDAGLALAIVDRTLGGEATDAVMGAHTAAALTDPERGVMAYVAARALHEAASPWCLEAVADAPPAMGQDPWLCWPLQARVAATRGRVQWWTPTAPVPGVLERGLPCRWVVAAEPRGSEPLRVGDVWVLESAPAPTSGWLRIAGLDACLPAQFEGELLRIRSASVPRVELRTLELPGTELTMGELSALYQGSAIPFGVSEQADAQLWHRGRCEAKGELVVLSDALGLRVRTVAPP